MKKSIYTTLLTSMLLTVSVAEAHPNETPHATAESAVDTTIVVDRVQVSAVKQGLVLRSEPIASTIVGERTASRRHIDALKNLTELVPNLHIPDYGSRMTSSIYVRGLGARIDHPAIGLTIDNVPVMNKNAFDTELADIERIEVLRGPQSTLYGRNTMGGVVNIYTLSPYAQLVHFIFLILLATGILRVPLGFVSSIIMNGLELATAWVPLVFAPLFG